MRSLRLLALSAALAAAHGVGAEAPADRYAVAPQGFVTDARTGLIWQHPLSNSVYSWEQAAAYCRGLNLGANLGFRVPTLKELLTIVDPTRVRPAVDLKAFPNTPSEWFWTASKSAPAGPAAVQFATGRSGFFAATDQLRVRCVR
ncbi:MAG TPA: DUF1566 domain-containing protein [Polyangiales bacterium]|nr:DUF1566 domain-containing protein [Polyangiales bacterium]